jgi:hypothetical protein
LGPFSLVLVFLATLEETQVLVLPPVALLEPAVMLAQRLRLLAASFPTFTESSLLTARLHSKPLFLVAPRVDSQASFRAVLWAIFLVASRESSTAATGQLSRVSLMPMALEMEKLMSTPLLPLAATVQHLEVQVQVPASISPPVSTLTFAQS